jgi:acetyl esterase/lipase
MPVGYLITVALVALAMLLALVPRDRPAPLRTASWTLGSIVNESPFVAFYWILAATLLALAQGDLDTPLGWVALGIAGVTFLGTPVLVRRGLAARPAVETALADGLGPAWRDAIDPALSAQFRHGLPWVRILLAPLPFLHRGVARRRNLSYGDAGRRNRLDVYCDPARPTGAPVLIHLHGGGFHIGRKSLYSRAMLVELARHGWVCISASYRLRPKAVFPDYLVDAKKVIAWARYQAAEYGADPATVFVSGSSAGAHLAVTAALTPNESSFQPGFEEDDTSVAGAIGLFGYYGPIDRTRQPLPSSPFDYVRADAPPILVAHGESDMLVPAEHARALAERLRDVSTSRVVYVELPGGPHNFDLFHSIRFEILIDGIEAFTAWVRSRHATCGREPPGRQAGT